jgi:hypothetical protein
MMADIRSYQIRKATTADVEKVTQMMQRSFYRDEPLNVAVGLMEDTETCPELEEFFLQKLSDGMYKYMHTADGRVGVSSQLEVVIDCGIVCIHKTSYVFLLSLKN